MKKVKKDIIYIHKFQTKIMQCIKSSHHGGIGTTIFCSEGTYEDNYATPPVNAK
jgi:hypothetical protein